MSSRTRRRPRGAPRLLVAALALGLTGCRREPSLERSIRELVASSDFVTGERAAARIASFGLEALPRLGDLLEQEDPEMRARAAYVLGIIGRRHRIPLAPLIEALRDPEPRVRATAARSIRRAKKSGDAGVHEITLLLSDEDEHVRDSACFALAEYGPSAKAALPALLELLKLLKDTGRRWSPVIRAVGALGPEAQPAVPALTAIVLDQGSEHRGQAAEALGAIGPGAAEAVPALVEALKDPEARDPAAGALAKLGERGIAALIERLKLDDDWLVRESSAEALGKSGVASPEAKAALTGALGDKDHRVQDMATDALEALEGRRP